MHAVTCYTVILTDYYITLKRTCLVDEYCLKLMAEIMVGSCFRVLIAGLQRVNDGLSFRLRK